jgi:hypothetical protein
MRCCLFVLGLFAATAAIGTRAQAQNYPWCAQYGTPAPTNCGFSTYEQCMAAISGNGGFCQINNRYVPPTAPARQKSHANFPG